MRKFLLLLFCIGLVLSAGCGTLVVSRSAPLSDDYIKQVVAVSSFENRSGFSGQWKIGSGMSELLVSELFESGHFVVVERQFLDKVVGELQRQHQRMFREEGRVQQGRLKNARYLVRGVITDFSQIGGGGIFFAFRKILFGGKAYTARVALALTVVDVESGEIVGAVQCAGKARAREGYVKAKYKDVTFGGDKFFKTPLGVATSNALRRGIRGLIQTIPQVEWEPMVAEVSGSKNIIISGGKLRGMKEDRLYTIKDSSKPIYDPVTGDVIKLLPGADLAKVRIIEVDDTISRAEFLDGDAAKIKTGMVLKPFVEKK